MFGKLRSVGVLVGLLGLRRWRLLLLLLSGAVEGGERRLDAEAALAAAALGGGFFGGGEREGTAEDGELWGGDGGGSVL